MNVHRTFTLMRVYDKFESSCQYNSKKTKFKVTWIFLYRRQIQELKINLSLI